MRIGSTVLLSEQQCVQSYEWKLKRPLGNMQGVVDSLEEYHCDEIAIIRPVRKSDSFTYFQKDIEVIKSLKSMTPISFGGGIRSLECLKLLQNLPIERLVFSSAFINKNDKLILAAKNLFGHQAIQCLLPVAIKNGDVLVYNSSESRYIPLSLIDMKFIDEMANEVILFDVVHEGLRNCFDWSLLDKVNLDYKKLIISGGIGKGDINKAKHIGIASVLVDNKILHQEYSISGYKNAT
ncbi:MAG: phosphoribosylformimino-5-aminoimidazole carboxamide ribonucleotide (ProFAR) isomerase [Colwellia sp.]|jgi:phosphoribosylformimino-5-aminoimidazole carboxamide ribonucleotide (ProFAR) isomerase